MEIIGHRGACFDAPENTLASVNLAWRQGADAVEIDGSGAEIILHPTGKFLYTSNRGHDSIAIFRIDAAKGTLTAGGHALTQGKTPRNFAIAPGGQFLLAENQASDTIVVFKIDQKTGKLTPTGQTYEVGSPVCIRFLPL